MCCNGQTKARKRYCDPGGQTGPEGDEAGIRLVLDHLHDSDGLKTAGDGSWRGKL